MICVHYDAGNPCTSNPCPAAHKCRLCQGVEHRWLECPVYRLTGRIPEFIAEERPQPAEAESSRMAQERAALRLLPDVGVEPEGPKDEQSVHSPTRWVLAGPEEEEEEYHCSGKGKKRARSE